MISERKHTYTYAKRQKMYARGGWRGYAFIQQLHTNEHTYAKYWRMYPAFGAGVGMFIVA